MGGKEGEKRRKESKLACLSDQEGWFSNEWILLAVTKVLAGAIRDSP